MDAHRPGPGSGGPGPLSDGDGRLTAEGQRFVADWVAKNGSGVGLLRRLWGSTWRRAMAVGMTAEDVERCCEDATVLAATRYDPAKGAFVTLLAWYVRTAVQKGIDERLGWRDAGAHKPATMSSLDADILGDGGTLHHALPAPTTEGENLSEEVELVRRAVLAGPDGERQWDLLRRRYGLGCAAESLDAIGRRLRISKERVRQLESRTLQRLRECLPAELAESILGA